MKTARPRVLVCEDSRSYAAALKLAIEHGNEFEVVAIERSAEQLIKDLPQIRPDLITMDIELPGMSGLDAVEQIMSVQPVPILVLSSHLGTRVHNPAVALAAGALDALAKDDLDLLHPDSPSATAFRRRLKILTGARVIRHPRARLARNIAPSRFDRRSARVVGIGASTGGPQALTAVLSALPSTFPLPVFVVQHITVGFTESLTRWLDATVPLPVGLAVAGAKPQQGIWIAPDDAHMKVDRTGRIELDYTTVNGPHRPSVDELFTSLATSFGGGGVGVVLTGMGRDGADGARLIRNAGGYTIAQDEDSSAVFGMPKAAAELGVDRVLALGDIGPELSLLKLLQTEGVNVGPH